MRHTALKTIKAYSMLPPGACIVVGLSGGADSVALLHVLLQLQDELEIAKIIAAHINHGLRSAAKNDENFAREICSSLNVPIKIYHADVNGFAQKNFLSIEEAGRELRYFYLEEARCECGAEKAKIATGHHQNDNAETIIMNMSRGAGLRGLCGIPYVNGNIVRPLLNVSRVEIEKYIAENCLEYITDASNFSPEYTRNRIRHQVLPVLENAVNPQVAQIITKNAEILQTDEEYLEAAAQRAFSECVTEIIHCNGLPPYKNESLYKAKPYYKTISLDGEKLLALHLSISRRVIRMAIAKLRMCKNSYSNITANHIQAVLNLGKMKSGKEIHLPGLVAYKEYTNIIITTPSPPQKFGTYLLTFSIPIEIPEINMTICLSQTPPNKLRPPNSKKPILHCTKAFEYDIVVGEVFLRSRGAGDKIVLSGAKPFTKKLQDYFTDTKTPKHKRDTVPLIACGSDVLWVLDKKGPTSAKYVHHARQDYKNPFWVSLWRDADD